MGYTLHGQYILLVYTFDNVFYVSCDWCYQYAWCHSNIFYFSCSHFGFYKVNNASQVDPFSSQQASTLL